MKGLNSGFFLRLDSYHVRGKGEEQKSRNRGSQNEQIKTELLVSSNAKDPLMGGGLLSGLITGSEGGGQKKIGSAYLPGGVETGGLRLRKGREERLKGKVVR